VDGGVRHWHIRFKEKNDRLELLLAPEKDNIDVTSYIVSEGGRRTSG
jgi:hypothetical protein